MPRVSLPSCYSRRLPRPRSPRSASDAGLYAMGDLLAVEGKLDEAETLYRRIRRDGAPARWRRAPAGRAATARRPDPGGAGHGGESRWRNEAARCPVTGCGCCARPPPPRAPRASRRVGGGADGGVAPRPGPAGAAAGRVAGVDRRPRGRAGGRSCRERSQGRGPARRIGRRGDRSLMSPPSPHGRRRNQSLGRMARRRTAPRRTRSGSSCAACCDASGVTPNSGRGRSGRSAAPWAARARWW